MGMLTDGQRGCRAVHSIVPGTIVPKLDQALPWLLTCSCVTIFLDLVVLVGRLFIPEFMVAF